MKNPSGGFHFQVKHKHLIYKLYINKVYLLLRGVKLPKGFYLQVKQMQRTSFWGMPNSFWGILFAS